MLAHRELARLAEQLIAESFERQKIPPGQLTVHASRGAAMTSNPVTSNPVALLLAHALHCRRLAAYRRIARLPGGGLGNWHI